MTTCARSRVANHIVCVSITLGGSRATRKLLTGRSTLEGSRAQIGISPRRIPRVTASVRVEAPSLSRIELM
jgi:hypothetical protein